MTDRERSLLSRRALSGHVRLRHQGRVYLAGAACPFLAYAAEEAYRDAFEEARCEGGMTREEVFSNLLENGLWDGEREEIFSKIPQDVEDFKVGLYENLLRSNERNRFRQALSQARKKYSELFRQRHSQDHLSCEGVALTAQDRFLVCNSLTDEGGKRLFSEASYWDYAGDLLDELMALWGAARVDEGCWREVARTEPWRGLWSCRRAEGESMFGVTPGRYTGDQRSVAGWSLLYDGVAEHPECPPEEVLEEDDCLDGWLIVQRRKRKDLSVKKGIDAVTSNEKVRNADEVFVVVDTAEDARKVQAMNDPMAQAVARQRLEAVKKKGEVDECNLPDVRQKMRIQATRMLAESMKR